MLVWILLDRRMHCHTQVETLADVKGQRLVQLLTGPSNRVNTTVYKFSICNGRRASSWQIWVYRGSETLSYMRREERTGTDGRAPPRANGAHHAEHWELLTIWTKKAVSSIPIADSLLKRRGKRRSHSEQCHQQTVCQLRVRVVSHIHVDAIVFLLCWSEKKCPIFKRLSISETGLIFGRGSAFHVSHVSNTRPNSVHHVILCGPWKHAKTTINL